MPCRVEAWATVESYYSNLNLLRLQEPTQEYSELLASYDNVNYGLLDTILPTLDTKAFQTNLVDPSFIAEYFQSMYHVDVSTMEFRNTVMAALEYFRYIKTENLSPVESYRYSPREQYQIKRSSEYWKSSFSQINRGLYFRAFINLFKGFQFSLDGLCQTTATTNSLAQFTTIIIPTATRFDLNSQFDQTTQIQDYEQYVDVSQSRNDDESCRLQLQELVTIPRI